MSRRNLIPTHRRHLDLYDEDWDWLAAQANLIGKSPGVLAREIIHRHVLRHKAQFVRELDEAPEEEGFQL